MVFDRITLISIYDVLKTINENENRVSSILLNHTSKYGTKTLPKFNNVAELRDFVNKNYRFITIDGIKTCITCNEGLFTLLRFSVVDGDDSSIVVSNVRNEFVIPKGKKLNGTSKKILKELSATLAKLISIFNSYVCFPYIQNQPEYVVNTPYEYIQIIRNVHYTNLIRNYYIKTKRSDFPARTKTICR